MLKQGIDTTTAASRFLFHVIAAMDEMLADLISEGTIEGLESARARARVGGRPASLTEIQVLKAREMYDECDHHGKRKYTVAQIGQTFGVSRKTIYRHLDADKDGTSNSRLLCPVGQLLESWAMEARVSRSSRGRACRGCVLPRCA